MGLIQVGMIMIEEPPNPVALWLDDVRPMLGEFNFHARTASEAIAVLRVGVVEKISFDHDLGESMAGSGYDVACWIEKAAYFGYPRIPDWSVHSANSVGRKNINSAMANAEKYWNNWDDPEYRAKRGSEAGRWRGGAG